MAGNHRNERGLPPTSTAGRRGALHERLLWICVPVGIIALITMLLLFGWSIWTALLLILLLACPAVIVWAVWSTSRNVPRHPT